MLVGCGKPSLPEYWACQGKTQQMLRSASGEILESYAGATKLLIERYQGTVTQYVSKPFTGVYQECVNSDKQLIFRLGACQEQVESSSHVSEGALEKDPGKLVMTGNRITPQGIVVDQGTFQCQFLGNQISATIFE